MKRASLQHPSVATMIGAIRADLKLSQESLAHLLNLSVRTIVRWEKEGDLPPPLERERLEALYDTVSLANEVLEKEDLPLWFNTPKATLSEQAPFDLISSFRGIQAVHELLERARWGLF